MRETWAALMSGVPEANRTVMISAPETPPVRVICMSRAWGPQYCQRHPPPEGTGQIRVNRHLARFCSLAHGTRTAVQRHPPPEGTGQIRVNRHLARFCSLAHGTRTAVHGARWSGREVHWPHVSFEGGKLGYTDPVDPPEHVCARDKKTRTVACAPMAL